MITRFLINLVLPKIISILASYLAKNEIAKRMCALYLTFGTVNGMFEAYSRMTMQIEDDKVCDTIDMLAKNLRETPLRQVIKQNLGVDEIKLGDKSLSDIIDDVAAKAVKGDDK